MHGTGTKHIARHRQKSVVQWSVISKFACTTKIGSEVTSFQLRPFWLISLSVLEPGIGRYEDDRSDVRDPKDFLLRAPESIFPIFSAVESVERPSKSLSPLST